MGDGRLREPHPFLHIAGAQPGSLAQRTRALFLQRLQNTPAGGIGDGMKRAVERIVGSGHALGITWKSTDVNVRNC